MANPSFNYAALAFLNFWIEADSRLYQAVNDGDRPEKLAAISKAAGRFRIARNLHSKYDTEVGLQRYEPVLDIIDDLTTADFAERLADSVLAIRDKLSSGSVPLIVES